MGSLSRSPFTRLILLNLLIQLLDAPTEIWAIKNRIGYKLRAPELLFTIRCALAFPSITSFEEKREYRSSRSAKSRFS